MSNNKKIKKVVDFFVFVRYNKHIKTNKNYRTGGTDQSKHNELPHNSRKRGTVQRDNKLIHP